MEKLKVKAQGVNYYIEEEDALVLKIIKFAEKNDLTVIEAKEILDYQKSIAVGRMIAQGLKVYGEAFDELLDIGKRLVNYFESGKLNPRSDLDISEDKKEYDTHKCRGSLKKILDDLLPGSDHDFLK